MAPPRRAPANGAASRTVHYDDGESSADEQTDNEISARPARSHLRKRLSEAFVPDNDASLTAADTTPGGRVPLKSVNINDDEAEKRRRRKSAKIAALPDISSPGAGPSSEGNGGNSNQDLSGDASRSMTAKGKQPLNSLAAQPAAKAQIDISSSNFEEWMKMATDNKINAQNTWSFALIDYFHDMSLLRNLDDNSINFQRASCTLDGCVKIWTSRVDSVGSETTKLLSNLASGGKDDEDEENNSDNPDAGPTQKKKKSSRSGNHNLAHSYESLSNKKPDLEFSVDPLFKKTCADFDEGGARALLMNRLSLGPGGEGGMRVIFDASGFVFKEEDEVPEEAVDLIDLSELKAKFLPDLSILDSKAISHSLSGFSFSKDNAFDENTTFFTSKYDDVEDDADSEDGPAGGAGDFQMDVDQEPGTQDFFNGPDGANDDYTYGTAPEGGDDFSGEGDSNGGSVGPMPHGGEGVATGPAVAFDPRTQPNQRELVLSMDADGEEGFDYFDSKFRQNWAGPEHWKMRRPVRKPEAADANKTTKAKSKKEPMKIDFMTKSDKDLKTIKDELFAPPGKGASINLQGTGVGKKGIKKKKEKKDDHRLPDDMHFSSKQLVTLFLKPKFFLKMRGRKVRMNIDDGEVDDDFWAKLATEQGRARAEAERDDDDENGAQVPFSTQFFHDDDDDGPGGFDDPYGDVGPSAIPDEGEQDLLAATQGQTRRIKPETINYARRAKRVDVRKLKENIWKGLDIVIAKSKTESDEVQMDVDEEEDISRPPPTDPSEARQFSQVISGLTKNYPADKLEEISTSFCFICLLHLANEQGLKLEADGDALNDESDMPVDSIIPDDEDDEIAAGTMGGKKMGDIWGIKIYRDPNATQSA